MRFYEDITRLSENRLPARSAYIPEGSRTGLAGEWRFRFFADSDKMDETGAITEWESIAVPSCWELKGYQAPNYTNINYPFPVDPPYVPDENPAGIYEREFEAAGDGRLYLVLPGVSSCARVWLNGGYIGYTQGSRLFAEFDLTAAVKPGSNTLRIVVYKWCAGSYLEDQDQFRFHGIFREPYLLARPEGHLRDIDMTSDCRSITLSSDKPVCFTLFDPDGKEIGSETGERVVFTPENPVLWNAEKPKLYTVKAEYGGERICLRAGLREFGFSPDGEFTVNGKAVKLKGVNHHDTHPQNGWTVTAEDYRTDLLAMKQCGINCVRTSHYPPLPVMLELCDELGFYVVLETDLETHGFIRRNPNVSYRFDLETDEFPCTRPEWRNEFVSRMERAFETYKNHSCIFLWSTGNESGYGENHKEMIRWLRARRDGLFTHNEDAGRAGKIEGEDLDVYSRMYPAIADIEAWASDPEFPRPVFLCEYAHAMGNGPGDVWDYAEAFYRHKKLIGGCIWEWKDHTVLKDGTPLYGGDFEGELTDDKNFCCDGMVFYDHSFKAGTYEIKAAYAPFRLGYEEKGLWIENRFDFTDLAECELTLIKECDGEEEQVSLSLSAAPGERAVIPLPIPASCRLGASAAVKLKTPDGIDFTLETPLPVPVAAVDESAGLPITEDGDGYCAAGDGFCYRFDGRSGALVSAMIGGEEQLAAPVMLTAFRAYIDNDARMAPLWGSLNIWQGENLDKAFTKIYSVGLEEGALKISASLAGVSRRPFFRYTERVTVGVDGRMRIALEGRVAENAPWLPRLGYEFTLPAASSNFTYYGYGPLESYCDSFHHARRTFHKSDAGREYVPYVRPQEHGNHFGVRRLEIGALCFEGDFECAVSRYAVSALRKAKHQNELEADGLIHLRVDYKDSGVGSAACGPDLAEEYRLCEKKIAFGITVRPR